MELKDLASWAAIGTLFVTVAVVVVNDLSEDAAEKARMEARIAHVDSTAQALIRAVEARLDAFIGRADPWHGRVQGELDDIRRNELKELAEELDDHAVRLAEIAHMREEIAHLREEQARVHGIRRLN